MTDCNILKDEDDEIDIDSEEEDITFFNDSGNPNVLPGERYIDLAARPNSYACPGEYLTEYHEMYEEDEEEDFESENQEIDVPEDYEMNYSSFTPSPKSIHLIHYKEKEPRVKSHNKRKDRCFYKHRNGSGLRKPNTKSRDINECMILYLDGGYQSYSDKIQQLRTSTFNDLKPQNGAEITDESSNRDFKSGCGSLVINIVKLRPGSLTNSHQKLLDGTNHHSVLGRLRFTKKDIISSDIDLDINNYWDHVSHELLEDGAFVEAKYLQFKERALNDRAQFGAGNSVEMNMLYCFWTFYLRKHFNHEMYYEFLKVAREDNLAGFHYGMECFFRFCSYGLEMFWNKEVYDTFEEEAMLEYRNGSKYGLEKFKAFHINQKYDFPIPIKPETQAELDKYPTCRSFREPGNSKPISPLRAGIYIPQNRRTKRSQSDIGDMTIKIGTMAQPPMKPIQKSEPPKTKKSKRKNKKKSKQQNSQPNEQKPIELQKPNEKKPIEIQKPNETKPVEMTKFQKKKQEKNQFVYSPPPSNKPVTEKEKEMMEKKKQEEKEAQQQKMDIQSLPATKLYQPPVLTPEQLKHLQAPPTVQRSTNKYVPKCGAYKPKTDMGIKIGIAQQPQSLPKKSPFRGNRW